MAQPESTTTNLLQRLLGCDPVIAAAALSELETSLSTLKHDSARCSSFATSFLSLLSGATAPDKRHIARDIFNTIYPFLTIHNSSSYLGITEGQSRALTDNQAPSLVTGIAATEFYTASLHSLICSSHALNQLTHTLSTQVIDALGIPSTFLTITDYFEDMLCDHSHVEASGEILNIDDHATPLDDVEQKNILFLGLRTHWQHLLVARDAGLLAFRENKIHRIAPVGSTCVSEGLGSLICHSYVVDSLCVTPIYSGWVNKVEGIIVISLNTHTSLALYVDNSPNANLIRDFCSPLSSFIIANLLVEPDNFINHTKPQQRHLKKSVLVGQKNNYGHAVINDTSLHGALIQHDFPEDVEIILGNNDYFSTVELIASTDASKGSSTNKIGLIQESDFRADSIYGWKNKIVFPLSSYRPSRISLMSLRSIGGRRLKQPPTDTSIYLSLDNRIHGRFMLEKEELVRNIVFSAAANGINSIIVDGITALPSYTRDASNMIAMSYEHIPITYDMHSKIMSIALTHGLSCSIIDGLSFAEKIRICQEHNIICAFAPYGSSMMFPIYILNCNLGILGSEIFASHLESWRWHITRYCHPDRIIPESYVKSTVATGNGYIVSPDAIEEFIHKSMINCSNHPAFQRQP